MLLASPRSSLARLLTVVGVSAALVLPSVPAASATYVHPATRVDVQVETPAGPAWLVTKNPLASGPERTALIDLLLRQIGRQQSGDVIGLTTWSFHSRSVADALAEAKSRGVRVRVVVDKRTWRTKATKSLRQALGTSPGAPSYIVAPYSASSHTKVATFSHDKTVLISSANVSDPRQWNHTVVLQNPTLHAKTSSWVDRMGAGDGMSYHKVKVPGVALHFYPGTADPVLKAIKNADGRRITVQMATWKGKRGNQIARALIKAHRGGSPISINVGSTWNDPVKAVADAGIDVFSTRQATGGRAKAHDKLLVVGNKVFTGSANWGGFPRNFSEVVARITSPGLAQQLTTYVSRTRVQAGGAAIRFAERLSPTQVSADPLRPRKASVTFSPARQTDPTPTKGFEVAWSVNGGSTWTSKMVTRPEARIKGLTPDVKTLVRVRDWPTLGSPSKYSPSAAVLTTNRPHRPEQVRLRVRKPGVVAVRWQAPDYTGRGPLTGWVVRYQVDEGRWKRTTVAGADADRVVLRSLPRHGVLDVRMRASNKSYNSRLTPAVTARLS